MHDSLNLIVDVLQNAQTTSALKLLQKCTTNGIKALVLYLIFFATYHYLGIHQKFGFFKAAEPQVHFVTALRNWKVPFLWGIGITLASYMIGVNVQVRPSSLPNLAWTLPESWVILQSPNLGTDILYAIVGFYAIDFTDYWAHRLNHRFQVLYGRFPFAHFVHHNCVYLNPLVVDSSPFIHLAAISGMVMYALLLSQGLVISVALLHAVKIFSNHMSHLGCDPFPWLSRLNHRVGGWIPWIPLHHQYHHLPFVQPGNYGNITCLWDYVFKTVIPESVYHLETGKALPIINTQMQNGETEMKTFLQGKTRFNLI
jgi:sterol desaturase/sphingolipid hydroxylase (fatty acid hydroxylase superfamily)